MKLEKGFSFLKMRYLITDTGKIIVIPCRKTITRERQKLKKLSNLMKQKKMTVNQIKEQYKSDNGIKRITEKHKKNVEKLYKTDKNIKAIKRFMAGIDKQYKYF